MHANEQIEIEIIMNNVFHNIPQGNIKVYIKQYMSCMVKTIKHWWKKSNKADSLLFKPPGKLK